MKVVEEWIQWANEKTVNLNSQKGSFPKMERVHGYNTKLFYCYYTQSTDEGEKVLHICTYIHT